MVTIRWTRSTVIVRNLIATSPRGRLVGREVFHGGEVSGAFRNCSGEGQRSAMSVQSEVR